MVMLIYDTVTLQASSCPVEGQVLYDRCSIFITTAHNLSHILMQILRTNVYVRNQSTSHC